MSSAVTASRSRINQLDILRGASLLGILVMNIISFGLPAAHYFNPLAEGALSPANRWAFLFSEIFANERFMGLFSVLFGAGIVLFTGRISERGHSEAKWHFRRNFWLLLIGMAHAYLLWSGDILVTYAVCSVWLFFCRNLRVRSLLVLSGVSLGVHLLGYVFMSLSLPYWSAKEAAELISFWKPSAVSVADEVSTMRSGWFDQMPRRFEGALAIQTVLLPFIVFRATGMMLLGMALFKAGVLSGRRSRPWYARLAFIGLGMGLLIAVLGIRHGDQNNWSAEQCFFQNGVFHILASTPMVLGYIGVLLWLCKTSIGTTLEGWLAPVGRMAMTNYLTQTLLATMVMHGHGLGWFGEMGRAEMWGIVVPIWVFQILWSKWWLGRYRFGPAEWLWRSLTYWRLQSMRLGSADSP